MDCYFVVFPDSQLGTSIKAKCSRPNWTSGAYTIFSIRRTLDSEAKEKPPRRNHRRLLARIHK
eukprot:2927630-Amphidinium_carterae.1